MSSGMVDENLSSKVELFLGLRNLPKMDYFGKTEAKVCVYVKDFRNATEICIGSTESVRNSLNPDYQSTFVLEYFFEENQKVITRVFNADDEAGEYDVNSRAFIGQATFTLGDVVGTKGQEKLIPLLNAQDQPLKGYNGVQNSQVLARVDEVPGVNECARFTITGFDLDPKSTSCCFGRTSNPFLEIHKKRRGGGGGDGDEYVSWQKVFSTPVYRRTLNPRFNTFSIRKQTLCNSDDRAEIMFKVFHQGAVKDPQLIGQGRTNFKQILKMVDQHDQARRALQKSATKLNLRGMLLPLIHPDLVTAHGRRYKNSGVLLFNRVEVYKEASFLDYIQGGLNLKLMVAIDFTASNGEPNDPASNHYIDPTRRTLNKYEKAIEAIAPIVVPYDSDQMISVWGFGAKLLDTNRVSHYFPLTFNSDADEVKGVPGIIDVYRKCFTRVDLSGPTMLHEVIQAASRVASLPFTQSTQHYSVLLVLTDGVVNDMKATVRQIEKASSKPLSIIIIGIGDADFSDMKILDDDNGKLDVERDIVQFVPMKMFRDSDTGRLSAEVLSEIPAQVLSFMKKKNVQPMQRRKMMSGLAVPDLADRPSTADVDDGDDDDVDNDVLLPGTPDN
ncbi:unnamed protein product (mitochondrion) [Plasmodiophora brassicae]|uniref:C2 domain-containing protein n=1 Tax=Plasmodiophora brassicae TaxID=37360 RepID=A0A3P3Y2M8_PLABS|nr:unnamed protein product [Plasmodiophora brassicae]